MRAGSQLSTSSKRAAAFPKLSYRGVRYPHIASAVLAAPESATARNARAASPAPPTPRVDRSLLQARTTVANAPIAAPVAPTCPGRGPSRRQDGPRQAAPRVRRPWPVPLSRLSELNPSLGFDAALKRVFDRLNL